MHCICQKTFLQFNILVNPFETLSLSLSLSLSLFVSLSLSIYIYMTHTLKGMGKIARLKTNTLQWRYNGCDGVSNPQPHDFLLSRGFSHRWKKTSKLRVTGLSDGNSWATGEFPAQRASNAENVSIWWHHMWYVAYLALGNHVNKQIYYWWCIYRKFTVTDYPDKENEENQIPP